MSPPSEIACHLRDVEEFFAERYGKIANHDRPQLRMINQDEAVATIDHHQGSGTDVARDSHDAGDGGDALGPGRAGAAEVGGEP